MSYWAEIAVSVPAGVGGAMLADMYYQTAIDAVRKKPRPKKRRRPRKGG